MNTSFITNQKTNKMKKALLVGLVLLSFAFAFTACNGGNKNESSTPSTDKKEQLATGEMYTCTMHNEVMSNNPGHCSICGMTLVKQKMTTEQEKMMKEGTYKKSKEEQ